MPTRPNSVLFLLVAAAIWLSPQSHHKFVVVDQMGNVVFRTYDGEEAKKMLNRLSKVYGGDFYLFCN